MEAEKLKNNVLTKGNDLKNDGSGILSSTKQTLEEKIEGIITDASYSADDVLNNLEIQLNNL